jgi:tRNA(Arg) A34 adenosine deaminase TadA
MNKTDLDLIRASIAIAWRAREKGNHPFGALLADGQGNILLEAENSVVSEGDCTGHAETNLMRAASQAYPADFLAACSVYTSTEPCPMCSGAIFWGNVRRVVFGLSQERIYQIIGNEPSGAVLMLTAREVFARGRRTVEVIGPLLEAEAERVHHGFWG